MNLQSSVAADSARLAAQAANPLISVEGAQQALRQGGMHSDISMPAYGRDVPEPARAPLIAPASAPAADGAIGRHEIPLDELGFRAMTTAAEIDSIKYLRGELSLSRAVLADPQFTSLEKKETSTAWSVHSHFLTRS